LVRKGKNNVFFKVSYQQQSDIIVQSNEKEIEQLGFPVSQMSGQDIASAIGEKFTFKAPNWFVNNNVNNFLNGLMSEQDFINSFIFLLESGAIQSRTDFITGSDVVNIPEQEIKIKETKEEELNPEPTIKTKVKKKTVFVDEIEPIIEIEEIKPLPNNSMISQSVGAFQIKDDRIQGEILYIANKSFDSFFYNKKITSFVQFKNELGVVLGIKENNLNFTETERDERIQINELSHGLKKLNLEFFVMLPDGEGSFTDVKTLTVTEQISTDVKTSIPDDKFMKALKGLFIGTLALSLFTSGRKSR
jgi:hypothetical protein